jgi:uncharacterized protein YjlB
MFTHDTTRLLVAYTNASTTCRTPHFTSDLLVALKDDDVSIKRVSHTNAYEVELVVNGSHVVVHGGDTNGILSVRMGDKVVLASCARTAHVPLSIGGAALHMLFVEKYREGKRLVNLDKALEEFSFTSEDVRWQDVYYLEASPIVDAIHLLIPASSVA